MYNKLNEEDITKGYKIAGTGEIDYEGNVHRIGGIDKKVVAADKAGIEIFFAPYENGSKESNYEIALQTATQINSKMEIVPVDTLDRKSTRLNSSHVAISYAVFCLKKKKKID